MSIVYKVPWQYKISLILLFPIVVYIVLRESVRRQGGWRFIKQRLGFGFDETMKSPIWIHAASVGEYNAAIPLIQYIQKQQPTKPIIITTNTATAAHRVNKTLGNSVSHYYLPIDYSITVKYFLTKMQPCCALIMETELWPHLLYHCAARSIPSCIINARLSKKTTQIPAWYRSSIQSCLANITHILARNDDDKTKFIQLGANPDKIDTIGNIKFSQYAETVAPNKKIESTKPYVLAASTHHDEEKQLATIWFQENLHKTHLLIIAPRHPERRESIIKALKPFTDNIQLRSQQQNIKECCDIYIIDTMGEMLEYMESATCVFMGGSLVPIGGHNVLEPAALNKAIITGPYTDNFTSEVQTLLEHKAIIQVSDASELKKSLNMLLTNASYSQGLANQAKHVMEKNQNIVQDYYHALEQLKILTTA